MSSSVEAQPTYLAIGLNLAAALFAVQKEVGSVGKDAANPYFDSEYASLGAVIGVLKPLFEKHGILFIQVPTTPKVENNLALATILVHVMSGESLTAVAEVPLTKADPQGFGSAVTYTRRYALKALLGMVDTDDDGNAASERTTAQRPKPANPGKFSLKGPAKKSDQPEEETPVKGEDVQPEPAKAAPKKKTSLFPRVAN